MSSYEELSDYIRAAAKACGIQVNEAWIPSVALHLKRLLEASEVVGESGMTSIDLAPRFEP
jgi:hypothetical protein